MFVSALRKFFANRHPLIRTRRPSVALRLESLEERAVPATFTVGSGGYATIQAALNAAAASSGSDVVQIKGGIYQEALIVNDHNAVTLKRFDNSVVTISAPASVPSVTLGSNNVGAALIDVYGKNVTIDGLTVDGAGAPVNVYAGIRVIEGGSATIKNNTITNLNTADNPAFGIGIQIGSSKGDATTGKGAAKVNNNTVSAYLGAGVLVDGGSASATVTGNTITGRGLANNGNAQYGVQVSRGASAKVEGNTISGNDVDGAVPGGSNPATTSAGIFFFQIADAEAEGNKISGNDAGVLVQECIVGGRCDEIEVESNKVTDNNGFAGIFVRDSRGIQVSGNVVKHNDVFNGIALSGSKDVEVSGNVVRRNASDGIYLFRSDDNRIVGNRSSRNGDNGIFLEQSDDNEVSGNKVKRNGQDGVRLLDSDDKRLKHNEAWFSGGNGFALFGSTNNTISDSSARHNGGDGFRIEGGQCNVLCQVEAFANCGDGIRLKDTRGTLIADSESTHNGGLALSKSNAPDTVVTHSRLVNGSSLYVCSPNFGGWLACGFAWGDLGCDD